MIKYNRRKFITFSLATFLTTKTSSQLSQQKSSEITLTVSVAASLQDVMKAIAEIYYKKVSDVTIAYNFGSSGSLQQQIEWGAPVDIFISASPKQIKNLQNKNLLLNDTIKTLVKNRLVLIIPKNQNNIAKFEDLSNNNVKKIAIGNPESVPAGEYTQQVLTFLKLYKSYQEKLIFAKDVRQVLSYVETNNVDAGIVYVTDAKLSDKVKIVATAPENSHSPIIYPVGILKNSKNIETAKNFVKFLFTEPAKKIFREFGFISL